MNIYIIPDFQYSAKDQAGECWGPPPYLISWLPVGVGYGQSFFWSNYG